LSSETREKIINTIIVIASVYLFLLSIKLLGYSFKLFGKGFAETMIQMTSNPFAGLIIGIVTTSLIQSSSTTTSIVVGLVAGNALSLYNAIPIIMGANIGTTITNTIVSFGHIRNRIEFRRAFSVGLVHDLFNVCSVIIFFPIEIHFHIIAKTATKLEALFAGAGGVKMFNPLKLIIDPVIDIMARLISYLPFTKLFMIVISLAFLFFALASLVKRIRLLVLDKIELIINQYLFRNDFFGFTFGIIMTAIVQSSSVTTSLIIPLAGAGLVRIRQVFPYTLGANIGTTVTAILAAMATQNNVAITVAFSHLTFNIFGILIFYPLKFIPIGLAQFIGRKASKSTKNLILFIIVYILIHFIPILFIIF